MPYAGYRFPAEVISRAAWLYFRFPLSLRMVEEMLTVRGIMVSHETIWQWALKFSQEAANRIRRRLLRAGDKWHLDEAAIKIAGVKHRLWRAVDQTGMVLDVLVQSRRDKRAAKRLLRKLLKQQYRAPRVMIRRRAQSIPVLVTWWRLYRVLVVPVTLPALSLSTRLFIDHSGPLEAGPSEAKAWLDNLREQIAADVGDAGSSSPIPTRASPLRSKH
jgi:putative transposase